MNFFHTSIGGGITGIETIITIVKNLKKYNIKNNNKRILRFAIIDKKPENIPGGVAYSFENSQYGFFNNPLRLSPSDFSTWAKKKVNKKRIVQYLRSYGGLTGKKWIKKNRKFLQKNDKYFKELYLPRVSANFWMEDKLIDLIKLIKKNNGKSNTIIQIKFFEGEVIKILKKKKK